MATTTRPMVARKSFGTCFRCGNGIRMGQEIVKDSETGQWQHHGNCPDGEPAQQTISLGTLQLPSGRTVRPLFAKRSDGTCNTCGAGIKQGEAIYRDEGLWHHVECPVETVRSQPETQAKPFTPTPQGAAIINALLDSLHNGKGILVNARAGCGKTTLICRGMVPAVLDAWPEASIAVVAFNSHIAAEVGTRVDRRVYSCTMHALGRRTLVEALPQLRSRKPDGRKASRVAGELFDKLLEGDEMQLLVKLYNMARITMTDVADDEAVMRMADHYRIDINSPDKLLPLLEQLDAVYRDDKSSYDYTDMLLMPIQLNLSFPKFDVIFVDEAQDLNPLQHEFLSRCVKTLSTVVAVGDPAQSIYGFAGADVTSMPKMAERFGLTEMPLSVTFRCPKAHVAAVNSIVPDLTAHPSAPDGVLKEVEQYDFLNDVRPGDMVLCRTNAPLVANALALIAKDVKAIVRGRDIGKSLANLAKQIIGGCRTTKDMWKALEKYDNAKLKMLSESNASAYSCQLHEDQMDCLKLFAERAVEPSDLPALIEGVFADDKTDNAVMLSSVHKAKGLEAERIWILRPELMPMSIKGMRPWESEQEMNIKYVAETRSKSELYFVHDM